jgi:hypothetical protein
MFQFPGFALLSLCIQDKVPGSASYALPEGKHSKLSGGLPHSEILGSKVILTSPKLIAEYHVLHRLLLPRHPPNALFALDLIQKEQDPRGLLSPRLAARRIHCCWRLPVKSHTFPIRPLVRRPDIFG